MVGEFELSSWLQRTLVFQGLSRSQLVSIVQIAQLQSLNKGELLFKQGSEATGFFVVKSGRVKVFQVSPTGKEQILNIFESGENFAEVAALDGKPFPASAATLEPTELIFFPRKAFLDLLHQHPDIAINMLISLSQHLRHLTGVIEDLSFKDVPQRLATYLLKLSRSSIGESSTRSHPTTHPTNVVTLDLTKSQLASALGTIPATLSRAFYYLSSEGLIAVNGSQIELLDRDRLQELSDPTKQDCSPS
ncbi:Crp/Fnr family transcriptional regulator [Leptolyngbya sp. 7M]|nr:Crp/Fnr family transcriptional regulator [Leptolyngbya sp. 7M]